MPWEKSLPRYRVITKAYQVGGGYYVEREDGTIVGPTQGPFLLAMQRRDVPKLTVTLLAMHVELVSDDDEYEAAAQRYEVARVGPERAVAERDARLARRELAEHYAHAQQHDALGIGPPDDGHLLLDDEGHRAVHEMLHAPVEDELEPVGDEGHYAGDEADGPEPTTGTDGE